MLAHAYYTLHDSRALFELFDICPIVEDKIRLKIDNVYIAFNSSYDYAEVYNQKEWIKLHPCLRERYKEILFNDFKTKMSLAAIGGIITNFEFWKIEREINRDHSS